MIGVQTLFFFLALLQAPASPPRTPEEAVAAFRARIAAIEARYAAAGPVSAPADIIARLRERDVAVSTSVGELMATHPTPVFEETARIEMRKVANANTAALKALIPPDGWFPRSRYGAETATAAFMILQHAPEAEYQAAMLPVLERFAVAGEVRGADYAFLYDRVQMRAGKPQRYGSQGTCRSGVGDFHEIEDRAQVDERRRALGITQPLAQYGKLIGVGEPC